MTDCVLYTRQDGSFVILNPAAHTGLKGEKPEDALRRIVREVVPADAIKVLTVDGRDLPTDYRFHGAWRLEGANIVIDIERARAIHRDRLRAARAPLMAALDVEYQRADETENPDKKREIAARKQKLRDVTVHPEIDAARTADELAGVWPIDQEPRDPPPAPSALAGPSTPIPETVQGDGGELIGGVDGSTGADEPHPVSLDDSDRSRAAKATVRSAAAGYAFDSKAERLRYEQALLAHNGNVAAIQSFAEEAQTAGVSVHDLAERIVGEHTAHVRQMMRIKGIQDQALQDLDGASGAQIEAIAQKAVAEMWEAAAVTDTKVPGQFK